MEPIVATRTIEPALHTSSKAWRIPLAIFAAGGVFGALAALAFVRQTAPAPRAAMHECHQQRILVQREIQPMTPHLLFWNGPDLRVRLVR